MLGALEPRERVLFNGANLWYLAEGMLGPLFAIFAERLGGNVLDIAWAWAAYLITIGLVTILVGKLSDRMNKEKLMVAGYGLFALFLYAYILVSTPLQLFFVQIGLGIATAIANPTWYALYAKYEDEKHDGYTWGLANGAASIVSGVAIMIGGFIVSFYSFEALFLTMGTVQVIATLYQARILYMK